MLSKTNIEQQPSHHLYMDEWHMIVYSSADTKIWPFFKRAEGTSTLGATATITEVVHTKGSLVLPTPVSSTTSSLGQCLAPGDSSS